MRRNDDGTVGLTYDAAPGVAVEVGDVLVSVRGRAAYRIVESRRVRSRVAPNRWALRALRVTQDEISAADRVLPLMWNARMVLDFTVTLVDTGTTPDQWQCRAEFDMQLRVQSGTRRLATLPVAEHASSAAVPFDRALPMELSLWLGEDWVAPCDLGLVLEVRQTALRADAAGETPASPAIMLPGDGAEE